LAIFLGFTECLESTLVSPHWVCEQLSASSAILHTLS
jgi:hypothetical protein